VKNKTLTEAYKQVVESENLTGKTVRYSAPIDPNEAEMRFTVIEDNGDRVLIELIDGGNYSIKPRETVLKDDIEEVDF